MQLSSCFSLRRPRGRRPVHFRGSVRGGSGGEVGPPGQRRRHALAGWRRPVPPPEPAAQRADPNRLGGVQAQTGALQQRPPRPPHPSRAAGKSASRRPKSRCAAWEGDTSKLPHPDGDACTPLRSTQWDMLVRHAIGPTGARVDPIIVHHDFIRPFQYNYQQALTSDWEIWRHLGHSTGMERLCGPELSHARTPASKRARSLPRLDSRSQRHSVATVGCATAFEGSRPLSRVSHHARVCGRCGGPAGLDGQQLGGRHGRRACGYPPGAGTASGRLWADAAASLWGRRRTLPAHGIGRGATESGQGRCCCWGRDRRCGAQGAEASLRRRQWGACQRRRCARVLRGRLRASGQ